MSPTKWANTPIEPYDYIKKKIKKSPQSIDISQSIHQIGINCIHALHDFQKVQLTSLVPNKQYFSYFDGQRKSRAVNPDLLIGDDEIDLFLNALA